MNCYSYCYNLHRWKFQYY